MSNFRLTHYQQHKIHQNHKRFLQEYKQEIEFTAIDSPWVTKPFKAHLMSITDILYKQYTNTFPIK